MWWFHDEIARPEIGEFLRQAEKLVEGLHDARRSSAAERKRPIIFVCQGLGGLLIEKRLLMWDQERTGYGRLRALEPNPDKAQHDLSRTFKSSGVWRGQREPDKRQLQRASGNHATNHFFKIHDGRLQDRALAFEAAAAEVMLDEKHPDLPLDSHDSILYKLGRIGSHNVVIACLPAGYMGTSAATVVASHMQSKFRSMKFGFMVGIGGGVPSAENDIRLGDVVVSKPFDRHGGVVQWDFGKAEESGSRATGHLAAPPNLLLSVVGRLEADHEQGIHKYTSHIERFNKDPNLKNFRRPENEPDKLFRATYSHAGGPDCSRCDSRYLWRYPQRSMQDPILKVHYGTIASGNQVIKSAQTRDNIVNALGSRILCFEMEAAGLMNTFQCLVIRGISDYCDSHKHDKWQRYAAANAAAYTRELVLTIPVDELVG
ncbi:purine and uridine phosphorylase [Aureobasidium pullulans]|nr:purine and uridine phosphorylase [Aureobasidium pullulans]